MVAAGMTPQEALVAATLNAADHLQMAEDVGSIEPGRYADVIAVDGDPLADVGELLDVDFVMKGGEVYVEADEAGQADVAPQAGEADNR